MYKLKILQMYCILGANSQVMIPDMRWPVLNRVVPSPAELNKWSCAVIVFQMYCILGPKSQVMHV